MQRLYYLHRTPEGHRDDVRSLAPCGLSRTRADVVQCRCRDRAKQSPYARGDCFDGILRLRYATLPLRGLRRAGFCWANAARLQVGGIMPETEVGQVWAVGIGLHSPSRSRHTTRFTVFPGIHPQSNQHPE